MQFLLYLLLCDLLKCDLLILQAKDLQINLLLFYLHLFYFILEDLHLLVLLTYLLLKLSKILLIIIALLNGCTYLCFQGLNFSVMLSSHFLKFVLVVLLHAMQTLVVSLTLSHLGFLFVDNCIVELALEGIDLLELFIHLKLFIGLSIKSFGLELRDLSLKLFNVLHCFTEALILLSERCFVLLLNIAKISVTLIS